MNERSTEGEGACWEGVEMTTTPDQHYMYMCLSLVNHKGCDGEIH